MATMGTALVYGAGVIGSVYAARLVQAGVDVTVAARGDRHAAIREGGLRIRHVFLGLEERADVRLVERPPAGGAYDLALVTVRAGQIQGVLQDLTERVRAPVVLVIGNNFQGHAQQRDLVGAARYVLGFGAFGGYREGGVIVYLDGRRPGRERPEHRSATTLGVLGPEAADALATARRTLEDAGLPTKISPDIVAWLVCHAALVFPLAGAMYAAGGDQARVCRTRDVLVLGVRACREMFRSLRSLGVSTQPAALRTLLRTPEPLIVGMLSRGLAGEAARVAILGHANAVGGRDEIAAQARLLDARARLSGLPHPSWDRLLPYFDPAASDPLIPDGSRKLRLRLY